MEQSAIRYSGRAVGEALDATMDDARRHGEATRTGKPKVRGAPRGRPIERSAHRELHVTGRHLGC